MKIIVHDCSGHPFQVQLSRHLAARGHNVTHVWFVDEVGPKGVMRPRSTDAPGLRFVGIKSDRIVSPNALIARRFGEIAYGRKVAALIKDCKPDVVLSGNTPTEAQDKIITACRAQNVRFVYWLQDVYSAGVTTFLSKQMGIIGQAIGWYYRRLDRCHMRDSDAIVAITDDFTSLASEWGESRSKVSVIENWGALDELPLRNKRNPWSLRHGLDCSFSFIYNGTLGRKHNPSLLVKLAEQGLGLVVVAAEGAGFNQLELMQRSSRPDRLKLLPLQPAEQLPDVLGTADVLVAIIEADAAIFAVPSKVLSYMCAGRPILLAAPKANLAARTVERAQAGIVVDPSDGPGFLAAARRLFSDKSLRTKHGANGRCFAERTFDMDGITTRFEQVLMERN
jgi:colanic acid biosynthesis glycosyl transferase WcaI